MFNVKYGRILLRCERKMSKIKVGAPQYFKIPSHPVLPAGCDGDPYPLEGALSRHLSLLCQDPLLPVGPDSLLTLPSL